MARNIRKSNELTPKQNLALKQLYKIIRDILLNFRQQMINHGFVEFEETNDFVRFCIEFKKLYQPVEGVSWRRTGCGIIVGIPPHIKQELPNLAEPFSITFPREEGEHGGMVYNGWGENSGKTDEMRINLSLLMNDFNEYKYIIQHELNHIVFPGSSPDESQDNILIRTKDYMCDVGEISSNAKESALRYYKMFPQDTSLDFNKFKQNFYKKGIIKIDNYIKFGEDTENLINKYKLDKDQAASLLNCYNKFIQALSFSFNYFKQKI